MYTIQAKKRDNETNLSRLRKSGEMPAVFYGANKQSVSLSIDLNSFKKMWREAGESSTIQIVLSDDSEKARVERNDTQKTEINALIHDVQLDPITSEPIHADFLVIDLYKKVRVKIPLEFTGISEAVKNGLGMLVKVLHEVEVEALPNDLPHNLSVDISKLVTLDDNIIVSDIVLPKNVTMITKDIEIVSSIVAQKEEKAEEVVDLSKIEVEKRGKKEEEAKAENTTK